MIDHNTYCMDLVRERDRDRYWCALLSIKPHQNDLFTLYALNTEIAEIGFSVTEPLIGHMRLRWWLDALTPIYDGNPPQHPVAVALSELVSKRNVPRSLLEQLIEGRARDLDDQSMESVADIKTYASETSSILIELSFAVMGQKGDTQQQAAHHLGIAWALLGILRRIPFDMQRGRIFLPNDLNEKHGFNPQSLLDHGYKGQSPDGLLGVVSELISEIQTHLEQARTIWVGKGLPFVSPLLIETLTDGYIAELVAQKGNPFQLNQERKGPRVRDMIRLKIAVLLGRF